MGKIYRIPIPRAVQLIKRSNRRYVLLIGVACIFATLAVGTVLPSGTGIVAAKLLAYGLALLFIVGLFWEDWSRITSRLIVVVSVLAILACVGFAIKRVYDVYNPLYVSHTAFKGTYTTIESIWSSPAKTSKKHHESKLQQDPIWFVSDLMPFSVSIFVFLLAARGAIREEYNSNT